MNSLHYAIASIVDANTGFGLQEQAPATDYRAAAQYGRRIRAKSFIDLLGLFGRRLAALPSALRDYSERKRKIREVVALSDRQLDDIGLNRGDVIALETGAIGPEQLEARRIENLGTKTVQLYRGKARRHASPRHAVNEAIFAKARCA